MNEIRPHLWKLAVVLGLWLLASHYDYQDQQRRDFQAVAQR
jgi:hypothetical protein